MLHLCFSSPKYLSYVWDDGKSLRAGPLSPYCHSRRSWLTPLRYPANSRLPWWPKSPSFFQSLWRSTHWIKGNLKPAFIKVFVHGLPATWDHLCACFVPGKWLQHKCASRPIVPSAQRERFYDVLDMYEAARHQGIRYILSYMDLAVARPCGRDWSSSSDWHN